MHRYLLAAALCGVFVLGACSPTMNWREVRIESTPLQLLLPCKPDHGSKRIPLAAEQVELRMAGCEAGGVLFAVSHANLNEGGKTGAALVQWQAAMLKNLQASSSQTVSFHLQGASVSTPPVRMTATGHRQDGRAVEAQGVWFVSGAQVFHAVMYADKISPDVADTFFSSLSLQ